MILLRMLCQSQLHFPSVCAAQFALLRLSGLTLIMVVVVDCLPFGTHTSRVSHHVLPCHAADYAMGGGYMSQPAGGYGGQGGAAGTPDGGAKRVSYVALAWMCDVAHGSRHVACRDFAAPTRCYR
jgi:hypothetical protein